MTRSLGTKKTTAENVSQLSHIGGAQTNKEQLGRLPKIGQRGNKKEWVVFSPLSPRDEPGNT